MSATARLVQGDHQHWVGRLSAQEPGRRSGDTRCQGARICGHTTFSSRRKRLRPAAFARRLEAAVKW